MDALRGTGLTPVEQTIAVGANVLATLPGRTDRWVMVAAHYDHLGKNGRDIYRGADDNAAAVAILMDVARALARGEAGARGDFAVRRRGAAPFLQTPWARRSVVRPPTVPLDRLDLMICIDLVGHAVGPTGTPEDVRQSSSRSAPSGASGPGAG